ncbi:MAG: prepilin-type N-terminal cleavage/methylation domain-containing protein [Patescibacteria group bacterium]
MKGFTLIETMVAITILTFAIAGPMFTASRSIIAAQTARDQLTAMYLAQEGIEYVRMMRDNAYLEAYHEGDSDISSKAWDNFLNNPASDWTIAKCRASVHASKICTLGSILEASPLVSCPSDTCDPLYLTNCTNSSGELSCTPPSIYTSQDLSGSVVSPFTRSIQGITITENEVKIVSTVSWNFHGTPYAVTVSDHLTAWH